MSKGKSMRFSSTAIVQLALGLFFVVLGIVGILPQAGEGIFGLSKGRTVLEVVFGVIEACCGLFFIFDSVKRIPRKTSLFVILVIFCLWILRIVISEFVKGIDLDSSSIVFHPNFWTWMLTLSIDLVVASVLWFLYRAE